MILAAGIHRGAAMETYLSACTPGPGVSGSDLKRLMPEFKGRCPAWAFARWSGNPARVQDDDTDAMAFGRAAHTLTLEGEAVFGRLYVCKPDDMSFATREGKAWRADNADREILSAANYALCYAVRDAVMAHPAAAKILSAGEPEVTAVVQDGATGLWLKARPDWLRPGLAVNLKTALSAEQDAFARQCWALGYHVSAALCIDVLAELGRPASYAYIVVEKDPPYCVAVRTMVPGWIEAGRTLYRKALRTYADCIASGKWPAYGDAAEDLALPPWSAPALQRIYEAAQAPQQPFPKQEAA